MKQLIEHLERECTKLEPVQIGVYTYDKRDVDEQRIEFLNSLHFEIGRLEDELAEIEEEHRELAESGEPIVHLTQQILQANEELKALKAQLAEAESFQL